MDERIRFIGEKTVLDDQKHILLAGNTGSGKTNLLERLAQEKWLMGYKVILFSLKGEMCQMGFPETDASLVEVIRNEYNSEPRPFPHKVFVPFARNVLDQAQSSKMLIKLPRHEGRVLDYQAQRKKEKQDYGYSVWKPFKISFKDLDVFDLIAMLKKTTDAGTIYADLAWSASKCNTIEEFLVTLIQLSAKEGENKVDLIVGVEGSSVEAKMGSAQTFTALLGAVAQLQKTGLICEKGNPLALDFEEILGNPEEMITFNFDNLQEQEAFICANTILRKLLSECYKRKHSQVLIGIPELSYWAPSSSSINPMASEKFGSLHIIQFVSKQSRILGVTMMADEQSVGDVNSSVLKNFGWTFLGRMHKDSARDVHDKIIRLPDSVKENLPTLKAGVWGIVPVGSIEFDYPYFACPSLAYHKKEGENALDWVCKQKYIQIVEYADEIKKGLRSELRSRPTKEKGQRGRPKSKEKKPKGGDHEWPE